MNSLDAAREELERVRAQRDRAWAALDLLDCWIGRGDLCDQALFAGMEGSPTPTPSYSKMDEAYAAGRQAAAVLAEAKAEQR